MRGCCGQRNVADVGDFSGHVGQTRWRGGHRLALAAGLAIGTISGCSLALDFQQCVSDMDCIGRGAPGESMSCHADGYCSASAEGSALSDAPRVAFVYIGPVGDHGWTKTHDDSRLYLEEKVPNITTLYEPSVIPSQAVDVMQSFIDDEGANIVVGTSFDFSVAVQQAAANNPDVKFLICSGFVGSPNLGSYFARMYMPMWLAGRLAAKKSVTGKIGMVGSVVIPETVRHINAFTLGARSENPDAEVMVVWVNEWFAPEAEAAAANMLIDAGVDVLKSGTDTTTALEVADGRTTKTGEKIFSIGYDNPDSCRFAESSCLTSVYYNWGPMVEDIVTSIVDGNWEPQTPVWEPLRGDPTRSGAYMAPINVDLVSTADRLDIEGKLAELASGARSVFPPGITDNTGVVRLDGAVPTDADLLEMCWFVEGVTEAGPGSVAAVVPGGCGGAY